MTDFHQITKKIGFLKELGLDYGNGPTAVMEWVLEHIHVYAGTPWWISIGLTALAVRVALFKPYMDASDVSARMSSVKDITTPIQKQMTVRGNPDAALKARLELQMIYKRAGIRPWKVFVPMLQVFTGYGMWNLLRGMSSLPVPGLEDGGALWFYNLTIPDPLFLLPAATSGLLYYTLKKGGETGSTTMSPQATRIMSVAFPAVSFLFTFWLPASVQLSFAATSGLSWIQMRLFQSARIRDSFGMYPLPQRKQVPASASPYKGTMRAPLTQAELDRKYEAATTQGTGFKAMVGRKMDEMTHTVKSVTSQGKDYLGQGKEKIAERLQKEELRDAQKYEERRKRELAEETEAKKKIASRRARRVESKMTRR
ncbi:60Kd inner membrane protein-domain-containing protein [Bisporella sp. PMI_857]|nr:60Kd inner membrane protein-domain-containing protein [Bisporella sp. PMI_857]